MFKNNSINRSLKSYVKTSIQILALLILSNSFLIMTDFKTEQRKNARVKTAYKEKEERVEGLLKEKNITKAQIIIRAFKKEQVVELWAGNRSGEEFKLITQYDFCSSSGLLGPKRREGDYQIPEGFYHIDRFNPWSNFYLSLGINYPNTSDKLLGDRQYPGGDIFIHGDCVTIGCIPITDDKIKELYVFAVEAKNNGQVKIPVHIFPARLTAKNIEKLKNEYHSDKELLEFWKNLKEGYDYFETKRTLPTVSVTNIGKYEFE